MGNSQYTESLIRPSFSSAQDDTREIVETTENQVQSIVEEHRNSWLSDEWRKAILDYERKKSPR